MLCTRRGGGGLEEIGALEAIHMFLLRTTPEGRVLQLFPTYMAADPACFQHLRGGCCVVVYRNNALIRQKDAFEVASTDTHTTQELIISCTF